MRRTPLTIILLIGFVDLVSFGLIIPLQAVYAARLGATGLTFGLLIGIYAAMQFIFNPILGRWSDRIGRRPVLLLSVAGSVGSHLLLGVADLQHSLTLLFVARILDGVTGANVATAQAYIADVTTSENRARGMGLFGAAFGLGFVVGPAMGAGLAALGRRVSGEAGTAWPAFGAAVISTVAFLLAWRLLPESVDRTGPRERAVPRMFSLSRLREAWRHARLRELLFLTFAATFAFVLLEATFVYLCKERLGLREEGTGLTFVYIGAVMVFVQGGLVGRLARRFGEARLLATGPFITAAGFLCIAGMAITASLPTAWTLLIIGCFLTPLGHGLTGPNLNSLVSRAASAEKQGATFGLAQGIASLARAVGPPVGGFLYDRGGKWPYLVGAAILVSIGAFATSIRRVQEAAVGRRWPSSDAAASGHASAE